MAVPTEKNGGSMRFVITALLLTACAPLPGNPNSCVSEAMVEGKAFELKGKPYTVVKVFGTHENCRDAARPMAAEIREVK